MSRLTFDELTPDDMPEPFYDDCGDRADAYMDGLASLVDCGKQTTERMTMDNATFANALVPAPTRTAIKPAPIKSNDPTRPYVGMYVEALHKWFVDDNLESVLVAFCAERDCGNDGFGYGGSDIGSEYPLYFMGTGTKNKRRIGSVFYNGNVRIDEVLS